MGMRNAGVGRSDTELDSEGISETTEDDSRRGGRGNDGSANGTIGDGRRKAGRKRKRRRLWQ